MAPAACAPASPSTIQAGGPQPGQSFVFRLSHLPRTPHTHTCVPGCPTIHLTPIPHPWPRPPAPQRVEHHHARPPERAPAAGDAGGLQPGRPARALLQVRDPCPPSPRPPARAPPAAAARQSAAPCSPGRVCSPLIHTHARTHEPAGAANRDAADAGEVPLAGIACLPPQPAPDRRPLHLPPHHSAPTNTHTPPPCGRPSFRPRPRLQAAGGVPDKLLLEARREEPPLVGGPGGKRPWPAGIGMERVGAAGFGSVKSEAAAAADSVGLRGPPSSPRPRPPARAARSPHLFASPVRGLLPSPCPAPHPQCGSACAQPPRHLLSLMTACETPRRQILEYYKDRLPPPEPELLDDTKLRVGRGMEGVGVRYGG